MGLAVVTCMVEVDLSFVVGMTPVERLPFALGHIFPLALAVFVVLV